MLYQSLVFLHILAAITWVGGMLFLAMVEVPLTRGRQASPPQGIEHLGHVAQRFRPIAWASILVLITTGLLIAWDRGIRPSSFLEGSGWAIRVLQVKVGIVAAALALSALHDFVLGPRLSRQLKSPGCSKDPSEIRKGRRRVAWIARANLLLVLIVIALGTTLARGSPV